MNATAIENKKRTDSLKCVKETQWVGNIEFPNIELCLASINHNTTNSGWYNPKAISIGGVSGIFLANEDGTIFWEQRIIKTQSDKYRIEFLTNDGYSEFEKKYLSII